MAEPSQIDPQRAPVDDAPDEEPADALEHSPDEAAGLRFTCPDCGHAVEAASPPAGPVLRCAACDNEFFAGTDPSDEADEAERLKYESQLQRDQDDELFAARRRQVTTLRRSLYRTRGFVIVAVGALAVAAGQLVWLAARYVYLAGCDVKHVGYVAAAVACAIGAAIVYRRVGEIDRELRESALADPEAAPDFSTLSDGSQRWQVLEAMGDTSAVAAAPREAGDDPTRPAAGA